MKLPLIEFDSGHKLVDNTMNDYDLHCPEHGEVGFAHWGIVAACESGKQVCWACRNPVGNVAKDSEKMH